MIDFIDEHNLPINAAETGAYLRAKLEEMKAKHPLIGDVRGMGLLQASNWWKIAKPKLPRPRRPPLYWKRRVKTA